MVVSHVVLYRIVLYCAVLYCIDVFLHAGGGVHVHIIVIVSIPVFVTALCTGQRNTGATSFETGEASSEMSEGGAVREEAALEFEDASRPGASYIRMRGGSHEDVDEGPHESSEVADVIKGSRIPSRRDVSSIKMPERCSGLDGEETTRLSSRPSLPGASYISSRGQSHGGRHAEEATRLLSRPSRPGASDISS
jgi:hypothetical protein